MSAPETSAWRRNVAAIIMDDNGRILLGGNPESSAYWHFPQGGVKAGESDAEALHREIREEVGLRGCRVLAEYAGLRYEYRRKNKKSHHWLGQQQIYYLLHCPGNCPEADCTGSAEFSETRWLPVGEVDASLFVPFKREVAARALAHFFPGGAPFNPGLSSIRRYVYTGAPAAPLPPDSGTELFAGGKEEAALHLAELAPTSPPKTKRLLALLIGMEGCGLKKSLRRLAHAWDPLATRYLADERRYAGLSDAVLPLSGELSLLALPDHAPETALLPERYQAWRAEGIQICTIALHISEKKQLKRLADKGKTPTHPHGEAWHRLSQLLAQLGPAYILPSDSAWYRDYLLSLVLQNFASAEQRA